MHRVAALIALFAALFAAIPTAAQGLLLGVGPSYILNIGAQYVPAAVSFSPETTYAVVNAPLGVADTSHMIVSWWAKGEYGTPALPGNGGNGSWSAYIIDMFSNGAQVPPPQTCNSETCPGSIWVMDNAGATITVRANFNDSVGGTALATNHSVQGGCTGCVAQWNDTWHHYLIVNDFTSSVLSAVYVDGVKLPGYSAAAVGTLTFPFVIDMNSPYGWGFNNHTNSGNTVGGYDVADYFMDTHTTALAGCATLIDSSGNVCPALIAKFYAAGPVDIGGATNCSLALGSQPELCFSGNKGTGTSGGFLVNKGTATGAFALANNVTISGTTGLGIGIATPQIYNAAFGPAGPPTNRPYYVWNRDLSVTGLSATSTTFTVQDNGGPIQVGDLLVLNVTMSQSAATTRNFTISSGWTAVPGTAIDSPVTRFMSHAMFYRVATSADITAPGALWSAPPTVTYTSNGTAPRECEWTLLNYRGANASAPIAAAAVASFPLASTSSTAPAVMAPTAAPSLLVSVFSTYSGTYALSPPATQELRFKRAAASSNTRITGMVSDEVIAASGSTGTRVAAQGAADSSIATNFLIVQ